MSALGEAVSRLAGEPCVAVSRVGGGCIASAGAWRGASGRRLFVKHLDAAPAGMFAAEAAGLRALGQVVGGCRVPSVVGVSESVLVLEWLDLVGSAPGFAAALGRGLAAQHRVSRRTFGFEVDNTIGATPQPNPDAEDWVPFFREHRLRFQWDLLRQRGGSSSGLDRALERLLPRLGEQIPLPCDAPSLLHGDLWTGNASATADGGAAIYDPATYFGCREADLAMTELFGSFGPAFRRAYHEIFPIEPGYEARRDLHNLYHVLNHANLFGGGYARQAQHIAQRYL